MAADGNEEDGDQCPDAGQSDGAPYRYRVALSWRQAQEEEGGRELGEEERYDVEDVDAETCFLDGDDVVWRDQFYGFPQAAVDCIEDSC